MFVLKRKDTVLVSEENEKNGREFKQLKRSTISFCNTYSMRKELTKNCLNTRSVNNDDHVYRITWIS